MLKLGVRFVFSIILTMFLLAFSLTSFAASADDFTVTLLGTGTPNPNPQRFGPSTLVEAGGQRLLFDIGNGVTIRLWQKLIPFGTVDAHFLTHLHSDHVMGIPSLWLTGWIQVPYGSRNKAFLIYGPPGTQKLMAGLWDAFSEDRRIRVADEKIPLAGLQFDAHDFKEGVVYEKNGVVVNAFEVDHGDLVKPCFGFKITYKNHSVVISGDTRYNANVEKAATGTDLLIHEVAMFPGEVLADVPAFKAVRAHHILPEEAGKLFAKAQPKLVVYTHVITASNPLTGIKAPTTEDILAATRKTYNGRVLIGADLMSFKIDDTGVSVVDPPRQ